VDLVCLDLHILLITRIVVDEQKGVYMLHNLLFFKEDGNLDQNATELSHTNNRSLNNVFRPRVASEQHAIRDEKYKEEPCSCCYDRQGQSKGLLLDSV